MSRAIIVLGAAVWAGGVASPTLARRARHAAGLIRGPRDVLILTGGIGRHGPSEASTAAAICVAEGVDPGQIRLEERSATTVANIANAMPLIPPGTTGVVLVSDRYHLIRAGLAARLMGLRVQGSAPAGHTGTARLRYARGALREILALPLTVLRALRNRFSSGQ